MTMTTGLKGEGIKWPDAWQGIEAKPLKTLDVIDAVRPRNGALELRWVNRVAGEGLRLNQMLFAGFILAKPEDLILKNQKPVPHEMIKEGKVIYGDLIAMLIGKAEYQAALKHNALRAFELGNRLKLKDDAVNLRQNLVGKAPSELARKIQTFVPSEAEVDRLSEANQKEGK